MSLASDMRPTTYDEVCGQGSTVKILKRQSALRNFAHTYLFVGHTGTGKTTCARILANDINHGIGAPIEIDAASNNGVDAIKSIIEEASTRSIDGSEYKIFIIDEVQTITSQGWQVLLKCIEELAGYTIFIFCTTEEQKVPETIKNRCMRFYFSHIPTALITQRLKIVAQRANITIDDDACTYISNMANGCMREAINLLEKAASYNPDVNIDVAIEAIGEFSYTAMFNLTNAIINKDKAYVLQMIEDIYKNGKDLRIFIDQYLSFVLDLNKYKLFNDITLTDIPANLEFIEQDSHCVRYITDYVTSEALNDLVDNILEIKNVTKQDSNYRATTEIMLTKLCR